MKTYIINLERSVERREYMEKLLKDFPSLQPEFVKAVDGHSMSVEERSASFDGERFLKRYDQAVRPGEIGCTLSHQKCYRKMVAEEEKYVLILEDDIRKPEHLEEILAKVEDVMQTDEPLVLLLSGWYWYLGTSPLAGSYKLTHVYDASLAHSYVINRSAAQLLIEDIPHIVADDWWYICKKGIKVQAVLPHLVNQDWGGDFSTTINTESVKSKSFGWYIRNSIRLVMLKFLSISGHFERA